MKWMCFLFGHKYVDSRFATGMVNIWCSRCADHKHFEIE